MRVMVIMKASPNSEAGVMPTRDDFERMIRYNTELVKAGIMKSGDGLKPSKFGKRVTFRPNGKVSVTDGPFAETKEQLAGFYLVDAKDLNEAIQIASKIPPARVGSIEVRPVRELAVQ